MTMLAIHHYATSGLLVEADALGISRDLSYEGQRCRITFPSTHDDFGLGDYRYRHNTALGGVTRNGTKGTILRANVSMVRVEVCVEATLTATQADVDLTPDSDVFLEATAILTSTANTGRRLVMSMLSWCRTELGQTWLEPGYRMPRVTWLSELRDAEGDRLRIGYNDPLDAVSIGLGVTGASSDDLNSILERAINGQSPDLASRLLADADFHIYGAKEVNPSLAVLLAAVACEVKVKTTMTALANDEQVALVNLILESPRDISIAASALFDKGLKALGYPSLREDDRKLYKAVVSMYEDRNKFAHRGDGAFAESRIRQHVETASLVFTWLDTLGQRPRGTMPSNF